MQKFSTVDLDQRLSEVKAAAARRPVMITEHRKDRYVLMNVEDYQNLLKRANPQRAYGPGETPDEIADLFEAEIAKLVGA